MYEWDFYHTTWLGATRSAMIKIPLREVRTEKCCGYLHVLYLMRKPCSLLFERTLGCAALDATLRDPLLASPSAEIDVPI